MQEQFNSARKWVAAPWYRASSPEADEIKYAFKACLQRPESKETWDTIWSWVHEYNEALAWDATDATENPTSGTAAAVPRRVPRRVPRPPDHPPPVHEIDETSADDEPAPKRAKWQTTTFSVDVWVDAMDKFWVDRAAQKELFLLAQHSPAGAYQANSIISKLMKKDADGIKLHKPGAFVHTAVMQARYRIFA